MTKRTGRPVETDLEKLADVIDAAIASFGWRIISNNDGLRVRRHPYYDVLYLFVEPIERSLTMKITPTFDRLLVRPVDEAQETKGGLLIPDVAAQNRLFTYGEVLGVGPGRHNADGTLVKIKIKVGDVVMFARKAGYHVPVPTDDGPETELVVLREPEILATVTDLPKATTLVDANARRILSMLPGSSARPDSAYENIDKVEIARREGWIEPDPKTGLDGYEEDPS